MSETELFVQGADRLHTTPLGAERIRKNLGLAGDPVDFCKGLVRNGDCKIYRKGKNWYCEADGVTVTVNARSYTVITAHRRETR